jgi:hypothetical protein
MLKIIEVPYANHAEFMKYQADVKILSRLDD